MAERSTRKRGSSSSGGGSRSGSGSSGSGSRSSGGGSRSPGSSSRSSGGRSTNGSSSTKLTGSEAIRRARASAIELLGRRAEGVLGLEPDDSNGWKVTLEIVELERIPRSTDVLGAYVISLDKSGELTGARRERRYYRNQADEE